MHQGDDLAMPIGTPLKAMSTGTVIFAGVQGGYGNKVEIEYWDGTVSYYGHMNSISATVGQKVAPGDVIGYSGNTGRSTGPHLHLEIHPNGGPAIDPGPWLQNKGLQ
nr:M23 family metallopeptidase [Knoellia sp. DB2414S]